MQKRRCLKCRTEYSTDIMVCPKCGTMHSPGAEKLGYVAFGIVFFLFILPDGLFWMENGRLPASIDEFLGAFSLIF